ncbi:hypothetical protein ACS0TY_030716 [Phlomoides rotata]
MSSIGASYAHVYVQQKRQKEKMKKMEEQKAKNGQTENRVIVDEGKTSCRSKRVHPQNFMSPADGERRD